MLHGLNEWSAPDSDPILLLWSARLVILPHFLATLFNLLGLILIHSRDFVSSIAERMKNLVQLYVDGLRVAMFCPLNNERHEPGRHRGYGMPT